MIRDGDTLTELQDWSTNNRVISKLPVPCTIEVQIRSSEQSSILKAKKFIPEEVTIVEEVVDTIDTNEIKRRLPEKDISNDILIKHKNDVLKDFTPIIEISQ